MTDDTSSAERAAVVKALATAQTALEAIRDGDVDRPIAKAWRPDGRYSKLDQCEHGVAMYEDCANCISLFAHASLQDVRERLERAAVLPDPQEHLARRGR